MCARELAWLHEKARSMDSIVEIGSFMGRSTYALLHGCKGTVWAVDHFRKFGEIDLWKEFQKNVGHYKNLKVLKMLSTNGAKKFKDKSVDMVFIDASHDYEAVRGDIKSWYPKAKKLICGHDYKSKHPGVMQAVKERFGEVEVFETIWFKYL